MNKPTDPALAGIRQKPPQLWGLDLVRGLCAIAVMLYHYLHVTGVGTFYAVGTYGVYLFFVLSGFALMYRYGDDEISEAGLKRFFLARIFRIAPLYVAVSIYQLLRSNWSAGVLSEFALNASLTFGFATPGLTSITPAGWSIGIEAIFYLAFPALLLCRSLTSLTVALVVFAAINHFYVAATYAVPTMEASHWIYYSQPVSFFVYFVGGMWLAKVYPHVAIGSIWGTVGTLAAMLSLFVLPHALGIARQTILDGWFAKVMIIGSFTVVAFAAPIALDGFARKVAKFLGEICNGCNGGAGVCKLPPLREADESIAMAFCPERSTIICEPAGQSPGSLDHIAEVERVSRGRRAFGRPSKSHGVRRDIRVARASPLRLGGRYHAATVEGSSETR